MEKAGREHTNGEKLKIAALADLHFDGYDRKRWEDVFSRLETEVDAILLCGDLTAHGSLEEVEGILSIFKKCKTPVVTVLGNHDCQSGRAEVIAKILRENGIEVLNGTSVVIKGVGFAGSKGFGGGFRSPGPKPFKKKNVRDFTDYTAQEERKIEKALKEVRAERKVVLLHYSPVEETLAGEPEDRYPFLGSPRLAQPIDTNGVEVVFHGHAHHGSLKGQTPGGVPVFNVATQVLKEHGMDWFLWELK